MFSGVIFKHQGGGDIDAAEEIEIALVKKKLK
jgi:hypothetical protein